MHFFLASTALLTLLKSRSALGLAVQPSIKDVTLNIVNTNLAPDGFSRSVVTANGTYPGPPITAVKGQTLRVKVNNKLTDATMRRSTSINFDGVFVSTPDVYDEGSPFVTTCPIAPASSYTYELPLGDQTGTFWYHSQLSVQYVDGLRGPLIIYDPQDPWPTSMMSMTCPQSSKSGLVAELHLAPARRYEATGVVPVSDSGTVNGAGRFNGGPAVPWSVVNVLLVNVTASGSSTISLLPAVPNNILIYAQIAVIEADGVATQPSTVDTLDLLAGQRYSVVLHADQPVANYWINAPFVGGAPARNLHQNATLSRAILRYAGAAKADPVAPMTSGPVNGTAMIEADLRPLVPTAVLVPDVNITLDLEVIAGKAIWTVNNISYLHPTVPTLNKILAGPVNASSFDPTENTFILPAHKTIQITFPPPMMMMRIPSTCTEYNNFQVIKSMTAPDINIVNPISRDVVGVGGSGTTIRFRTDNAGPWYFHCHIFWHMQAGLATVMLADPATVSSTVKPSAAWNALCPAYNALPADQQ
ncbi:laccase subfamily 2 [Infundibulicybe gibba]|nr:laccase subfamily 2 [Infundibulicybe gibba]